jgi:hypothetical protein
MDNITTLEGSQYVAADGSPNGSVLVTISREGDIKSVKEMYRGFLDESGKVYRWFKIPNPTEAGESLREHLEKVADSENQEPEHGTRIARG